MKSQMAKLVVAVAFCLPLASAVLAAPPGVVVSLAVEPHTEYSAEVDAPLGQLVVYERHDLDWRFGVVAREERTGRVDLVFYDVRGVAGQYRVDRAVARETAVLGLPLVVTVSGVPVEVTVTGLNREDGAGLHERCGITCDACYAEGMAVSAACGRCGR